MSFKFPCITKYARKILDTLLNPPPSEPLQEYMAPQMVNAEPVSQQTPTPTPVSAPVPDYPVLTDVIQYKQLSGNARLHVIAVYFNHKHSVNLLRNFERFVKHMQLLGVSLYIVECVLNESEFEVTEANNAHHVQLRTKYEFFHKENLINVGIKRAIEVDKDQVKYIAWPDADIHFMNENVVQDTIDALNRYQVVQMWSHGIDLDPDDVPLLFKDTKESVVKSFAYCYQTQGLKNKPSHGYSTLWHPGYAWAIRRSTYDAMGGLFDISILGAGDHHMAWAFVGHAHTGIHGGTSKDYKDHAFKHLYKIKHTVNGELGYVPGTIAHYWHGPKSKRFYVERWPILIDNNYEPTNDLVRSENGFLELNGKNIGLVNGIRKYFDARMDDCNATEDTFAKKL